MNDLSSYRAQLDEIDEQLMQLLAKRFAICREVAEYKAKAGIPMMQPERVAQVKERAAERAAHGGLNPKFGSDLYSVIIGEACRLEDEIIEAARPAH
jgi:chorismate mutase-like protein